MDTRVERIDDTTVKLSVSVEAARVERALDEAARHLAEEVKVPGFRKGKVPRRVLETRLGKDAVRQHAVRDSLPQFYIEALNEREIDAVGDPDLDLQTFEEGSDAEFTATVEVRPEFDPPPIEGVLVPHPEWEVTDEEVETELDRLRERFAEAETVQRPIQVGDLAVVSISASHHGQPVEDASVDDELYRVNDPEESGQKLDTELLGTSTGGIVKFTDTWGAGDDARELAFTVIVKDVKALQLPDADDDFALTASEFDTIDELRAGIREQLESAKLDVARSALRGRAVEAVAELVEVPVPNALVEQEVRLQLARLTRDAERHEIPFEQYLQLIGATPEELEAQLRENARQTVKAQLVVDRIGHGAGVTVTNEDLSRKVTEEAARLNVAPDELARFMSEPERLGAFVTDVFRAKTIDHILERVEITGAPEPADDPDPSDDADGPHGADASDDAEPSGDGAAGAGERSDGTATDTGGTASDDAPGEAGADTALVGSDEA